MTAEVCRLAPAKINLGLDVLAQRPDGFHDIRTIFQSIALTDRLTLRSAPDLTLTCTVAHLAGDDNLVLRAARLLRERHAPGRGAAIHLEKAIPAAAGLGGGSSDAAATLAGLAALWDLDLPAGVLPALAAGLGSDVAFFLEGGTRLATGRGERLERLPDLPPAWVVLWLPRIDIPNKTATLYRQLREAEKCPSAGFDAVLTAVWGKRWPEPGTIHNTFWAVYRREFPDLVREAESARNRTGTPFALSGAGPCLFAAFPDEATARRAAELLQRPEAPAWVVPTCDQSPLRCP